VAEQALYRKYRSSDFTEVVGQEHVTKTLVTALGSGRLSHAYLFTGPRGVGKTSVARLLARALNCTGETRPCNACQLCKAAINSSLDIIEIDAASNRSIDAVRELREKVSLAPAIGKYKVYIIDEVHMLTPEAFNALLKTLEEPPAHAVFVLATTEAHKLPETIISRTQRFTFKPITEANIIKQLQKIADSESIEVDPEALAIIAVAARGGFRDAIGMLDQVASGGERPVSATAVRALLGMSDAEAIGAISKAIAASDAREAMTVLAQLMDQGAQPGQVANQLVNQWREVLFVAVGSGAPRDEAVKTLAGQLPTTRIGEIIGGLLEVTRSHWPREALEVAVVRLAAAEEPSLAPRAAERAAAKANTPPAKSHAPAETAPVPQAEAAPTGDNVNSELWPKVLSVLKHRNSSLCALLQMYPMEFGDDRIIIKSRFNFHRDLFLKSQNRSIIEEAVQKVYGRAISVTAITDENAAAPARRAADSNSELITSALEILGGEVVD
jgi:DNA polymerase-3 subunit gamma/tau